MVFAQARRQSGSRPAQSVHRFNGHQAMRNISQNMRRDESVQVLLLDPFHQPGASAAVLRMVGEVIDKDICIEKDRCARWKIVKYHGDSVRPNSGSVAIRSRVSASPVHGIM